MTPSALETWIRDTLEPALAQQAERRLSFETSSGIPRERAYLPASIGDDYLERLGFPGD